MFQFLSAIPGILASVAGTAGSIAGTAGSALGTVGSALGGLGGIGKMALPLLGQGVSGALSGASGGLFGGKTKTRDLRPPEEKSQSLASQALIPFYLQLISGQMPDYLKRYLAQTQGALSQQMRGQISEYLRQVGSAGMDFGPQQAAALSQMYQGITPALTQALTSARLGLTEKAIAGLQQWSPKGTSMTREQKAPSTGATSLSGTLGGLGTALGGLVNKTPSVSAGTGSQYSGTPISTQGAQDWIRQSYQQLGRSKFPYVPQELYPQWAR